MDINTPVYFLSDIAQATGIEPNTLQTWIRRQMFKFGRSDRQAKGKGSRILVSRRTIYRAAIAAEITHNGVPPARAFNAAAHFTDMSYLMPDGSHFEFGKSRLNGQVLLVLHRTAGPVEDADQTASILQAGSGLCTIILPEQEADLSRLLFPDLGCASALVIDCSALVARVDRILG